MFVFLLNQLLKSFLETVLETVLLVLFKNEEPCNKTAIHTYFYFYFVAVGEPGCCFGSTCLFAVKNAIEAARADVKQSNVYFQLGKFACLNKISVIFMRNNFKVT